MLPLLLFLRDDIFGSLEDLVLRHCHGQLQKQFPVDWLDLIKGYAVGSDNLFEHVVDALHALLFLKFPEELLQVVLASHVHEALAPRDGHPGVDVSSRESWSRLRWRKLGAVGGRSLPLSVRSSTALPGAPPGKAATAVAPYTPPAAVAPRQGPRCPPRRVDRDGGPLSALSIAPVAADAASQAFLPLQSQRRLWRPLSSRRLLVLPPGRPHRSSVRV